MVGIGMRGFKHPSGHESANLWCYFQSEIINTTFSNMKMPPFVKG